MLNKKEISVFIVATLILGFCVSLADLNWRTFLYGILSIFLILLINILAKKITGYYLESEVEIKLWQVKQYWFKSTYKFKRPTPMGIFLPIIFSVLTLGHLTWLASLIFDVKAKVYRAAKRHGLYSFSEMSEFHIGLIAAAGIFANLFIAFISYLINLPIEMNFVTLSIWFCFFNMLPIADLDGNKIFFGNIVLWAFTATITLIAVLATIIII